MHAPLVLMIYVLCECVQQLYLVYILSPLAKKDNKN